METKRFSRAQFKTAFIDRHKAQTPERAHLWQMADDPTPSPTATILPSSPTALHDPEPVVVPADEREKRLFKRIREILPAIPAGATNAHNTHLFSYSDGRGGPAVYWCECTACKKPGEYRHPVFHGAYVPRQNTASAKEPTPLRIVVKTFALEGHNLYVQELMTYEQLELCVPRPCAPLVMHGTHRRKGLVNAGENEEHSESKLFIAVLHRDTSLSEFLQGHGNNLSKCLKVARGLVQAVAQCNVSQVVHRDLKPGNVLVHDPNGKCQVELIDFEGTHVSHLQSTSPAAAISALWGPPPKAVHEMARALPEPVAQLRRQLWSLGMLLYEILRNATCKIDVETVTPQPTAEQQAAHEQWMTALSATSNGIALRELPLVMRDVGYGQHGVDLTVADATFHYQDGIYFPPTIHPLLKDLMARVMGMDPDNASTLSPANRKHSSNRSPRML
jgi:hypothetical protein